MRIMNATKKTVIEFDRTVAIGFGASKKNHGIVKVKSTVHIRFGRWDIASEMVYLLGSGHSYSKYIYISNLDCLK